MEFAVTIVMMKKKPHRVLYVELRINRFEDACILQCLRSHTESESISEERIIFCSFLSQIPLIST